MKKIGFRGLNEKGIWQYGFYFHVEDDSKDGVHHIVEHTTGHQHNVREVVHVIDGSTVGQFTGLQDSECNDIYEGDIIEFDIKEWGDGGNIFTVTWNEDEAQWSFGGGSQQSDMQFRTVIGNIYENPELLTKTKCHQEK